MSTSLLFAHPYVISLRNRLRGSSVLRELYGRFAGGSHYEARFSQQLLGAVGAGDAVWDVGANVGVYAAQFAERGAANVVCFEPAPAAVVALQERFPNTPARQNRVRIVPIALADRRGTAMFSADGTSPDNQIGASDGTRPTVEVQVRSADEALAEFALPTPNVVKIDVEGYELEVIQGMAGVLSSKALRSVFVEVHFSLLHNRKLDGAPAAIMRILRERGFQVHWADPSHICAQRR
jgi:FkbM family methyltransferase